MQMFSFGLHDAMNFKLAPIAVACGLCIASTAVAQTSNVQLYGRANLGIDIYEASGSNVAGADRDSRVRVFDNSSRVGLRGTEDLGNGLKAIFQIETGVNVDNGSNTGQGGQGNGSTGFWASRDSYVGLDSTFGRLTFGRQSIYYSNGVNAQFAANYINAEVPWTDGRAFGRVRVPASRQSNVVLYTTPTFAGLNASLYYSPNAQEAVQAASTSDTDGQIWGATARGTWGPFYGQFDYVSNKGNSPATGVRTDVSAYKLGASWGYMPGARIGLIGTFANDNNATGLALGDEVEQWGWTINWEHTFGNFQVMAQYGEIGNLKDCDSDATPGNVSCGDSSARGYMVGLRYFMSKRTWVYASYNLTSNKSNQFADYTNAGYTSVNGAPFPYGADPEVWALGILHNF
ncbi:MAG TPA: porin [Burkholderiales bacterium]|nr:porin [Burkholderiales bacterium]